MSSYAGVAVEGGYKHSTGKLFLNGAEGKIRFNCNLIFGDTRHNEVAKHFGIKEKYGKVITVKYAEFSHPFIPFNHADRLIYEIAHDGETIFPYEYFINKFSNERKILFIFTALFWMSGIGFAVIYGKAK